MLLNNQQFIDTSAELVASDPFTDLMNVAIQEFEQKHSGGATEYEFNYNKQAISIAKSFRDFLTQLVFDKYESVEVSEDDDEPQFADK